MSTSPFVVNVAVLRRNPGTRRQELCRGPLDGLQVVGCEVAEGAEVVVDLVLESVPGAVVATGHVRVPWSGECRRCLRRVGGNLDLEVRELFEKQHHPDDTYPLDGDTLDLEPLARDAVLLELPLAPLCQEACQGLCASCGADRNGGDCGCVADVQDPRWAALDALREN